MAKIPGTKDDFAHITRTSDGTEVCDLKVLADQGPEHVGGYILQHVLDDGPLVLLTYGGDVVATLMPGDHRKKSRSATSRPSNRTKPDRR